MVKVTFELLLSTTSCDWSCSIEVESDRCIWAYSPWWHFNALNDTLSDVLGLNLIFSFFSSLFFFLNFNIISLYAKFYCWINFILKLLYVLCEVDNFLPVLCLTQPYARWKLGLGWGFYAAASKKNVALKQKRQPVSSTECHIERSAWMFPAVRWTENWAKRTLPLYNGVLIVH